MSNQQAVAVKKDDRNIIDIFVLGARKGWDVGINNIVPNTLMAFIVIRIFNLTGILDLLGNIFAPVMAIFGLPGQAVVVLFTAMLAMGGGVGAAGSLYADGTLSNENVTILMPAIFLLGAKIQYVGRLLGTIGIPGKYYLGFIGISVINAFIAMFIMRLLIALFNYLG